MKTADYSLQQTNVRYCPYCGNDEWAVVASYRTPPQGEVDYGISGYRRDLLRCARCGHFENRYGFDLGFLYSSHYWDSTYGDRVLQTFEKIMALPSGRSDNRARVEFVDTSARRYLPDGAELSLLDIGSGLCVFPAAMRESGWHCTALDPDPRAGEHARNVAKVDAITGDFMQVDLDRRFNLVSLNKVLEHVPDSTGMLSRVGDVLAPGGLVYIELPDGEGAFSAQGPDREEFFVEHFSAFSAASMSLLIARSGFSLITMERIVEPSGKFTLRAFAGKA